MWLRVIWCSRCTRFVFIWVLPLAQWLFLRFFHRLELISAYEYLERRFNLPLRTICSLLFICVRTGWMATALYATGLALTQVTGWSTASSILVIGGITTIYSALGGMKAVIWTDVAQFFVFVAGIVLVFVRSIGSVPGGLTEIWTVASAGGHTRLFDWTLDPTRVSTLAVLVGGTFLVMISYGVDQVVIQRFISSASSTAEIRRSLRLQVAITPVIMWMLALTGLALVGYYRHFPTRIPAGLEPDKWFPYFIVHELPPGIFGNRDRRSVRRHDVLDFERRQRASLQRASSISTAASAPGPRPTRRRIERELRISRGLTLFWGFAASLLALVVGRIGVIALISKTLSGFFGGVLLGVFLLGIVTRRSNGPGVLLGGLLGFATVAVTGLGTPINLFWYAPIGCLSTMLYGWVLSRLFAPPPPSKIYGLTLETSEQPVEPAAVQESAAFGPPYHADEPSRAMYYRTPRAVFGVRKS